MSTAIPLIVIVVAAFAAFLAGALIARRRGHTQSREVVARCHRGHLFLTVWSPRLSLRALDLGWVRLQRCPVGDHWTAVRPVDEAALTPDEKRAARKHRDAARS